MSLVSKGKTSRRSLDKETNSDSSNPELLNVLIFIGFIIGIGLVIFCVLTFMKSSGTTAQTFEHSMQGITNPTTQPSQSCGNTSNFNTK